MHTIFRYVKIICFIILVPTGLLCFIYDNFIWYPGRLSDSTLKFFDVIFIIGTIDMCVLIITYIVEKIIWKIKFKKLLKNK